MDNQKIQEHVQTVREAVFKESYSESHLEYVDENSFSWLQQSIEIIEQQQRENTELLILLKDVSELLSWRDNNGTGPKRALKLIYTWLMKDKEDTNG